MSEEEELASLGRVKDLLTLSEDESELTYEQRLALEHAKQFAVLADNEYNKLVEELIKLERVSEQLANKIAELLPQHPDEVRPIFAKERFTLEDDEIKTIIELVKKYI